MKPLWVAGRPVGENARIVLPHLFRRLMKRGARAFDEGTPDALHAFRLEVKRFRYTLEIFAPVCGSWIEERLEQMRKLQTKLGHISDGDTARGLLGQAAGGGKKLRRDYPELIELLEHRVDEAIRGFRALWREGFVPLAAQEAWLEDLGRAGQVRPAARRRKPMVN